MTLLQAIALGIIQGLTEFVPISSSAHLALAHDVLGWGRAENALSFDVALHVGTLAAVLWYFRQDWLEVARSATQIVRTRKVSTESEYRALYIGISLLPAVAGGLLLRDLTETTFRDTRVIAVALIVLGVILWLADRTAASTRSLPAMRARDAWLIGLAQVLAFVPGVSRSGATITAGRLLSFDRVSAARFSFLMSTPVIAAAAILQVPEAVAAGALGPELFAGAAAAALSGTLAIGFLLRFLTVRGFAAFAGYRVALGLIVYAIAL